MLSILSSKQNKIADEYTIANEPILSINLMERAALACKNWIKSNFSKENKIICIAGSGNNGGDVIAIARMLFIDGYTVELYILNKKISPDNFTNQKRFTEQTNLKITFLDKDIQFPIISINNIVIEGIFGSGLTRSVSGFASKLIEHINKSKATIVSIDLPSGLFADDNSSNFLDNKPIEQKIISANYTLAIEMPFLSLLLSENNKFVGEWHSMSIGLDANFIKSLDVDYFLIEKFDIKKKIRTRGKFDHKGNFGHALLISGKKGSYGATVLSSRAALKAGLGLLSIHVPESANHILQISVPEAMLSFDSNNEYISNIPIDNKFSVIGIGPSLGTEKETINALFSFLQKNNKPIVLDADALNCLAFKDDFLEYLLPNTILTPHPKEFDRLFGKHKNTYERLQTQKFIAKQNQLIIILKGAHTSISDSNGNLYFNVTGNPGMATAGSGDVLTGLILGLIASGYNPFDAALCSVYLHGSAGDFALNKESFETLLASDIIANFAQAFKSI